VRAIVGGYQVSGSGFQRAIAAQRQMGSSFKVLVYAQLLASRTATAATIYADQPASFVIDGSTTWRPKNYDGSFKGLMSVRTALAQSRNVIAVRALEQATIPAVISLAKSIGFTSGLTNNLTLSLGSAEASPLVATNAFATFAAGGSYEPPVFVTEIRGPRQLGDDGASTVYQHAAAPVRAIDPAVAWLTTSLMRSVVEEGTATHAKRLKVEIAGKTGTTNEARDAWFVGFTSDLVMGVWLGRDDNGPLGRGATGGGSAVPIWTEAMRAAIEQRRPPAFAAAPEGIVSAVVDTATGMLVSAETKRKRTEFFLAGTEPTEAGSTAGDPSVNDLILQGGAVQGSGEQVEPDDGF
jgi:penicillin-binding protein 1A